MSLSLISLSIKTGLGQVSGYLLGGLGGSDQWVQALGAGQRNIAAAMVVATMNFGSEEVVMIVVYSLIGLIIMTPLALELGKRNAKAGEAAGAVDPTLKPT